MTAWLLPGLVLAGAALFLAVNRSEFSRRRLPALLYHRFVRHEEELSRYPGTEAIFTIDATRFEEQMGYLKSNGYRSVTLREVFDSLALRTPLAPRSILITVDDGWTSNLDIMIPILRKHGLHAAFFITTSPRAWIYRKFAGLDGPLGAEQVRSLVGYGYEVGSHTVTHPYLIEMSESDIRREFAESKRWLEEVTGLPCDFLSIPGNFYDARIRRIAQECGYRAVFTANVGSIHPGTSIWDIRRLIVEGNFALREFDRNLRPLTICTRKIIAAVKKMPPHLLGATRYMALRERLFNSPLRALFIMRRLKVIALVMLLVILAALTVLLAG